MPDPHDLIAEAFAVFARAVQDGDLQAFEALCVEDAPPETELFARNSEKLRAAGWSMRILRIDQEGAVAEVGFELLDSSGQVVDEASVTFTEESQGWRLRAL